MEKALRTAVALAKQKGNDPVEVARRLIQKVTAPHKRTPPEIEGKTPEEVARWLIAQP
jgi:broad specificity phosphatase PhoE